MAGRSLRSEQERESWLRGGDVNGENNADQLYDYEEERSERISAQTSVILPSYIPNRRSDGESQQGTVPLRSRLETLRTLEAGDGDLEVLDSAAAQLEIDETHHSSTNAYDPEAQFEEPRVSIPNAIKFLLDLDFVAIEDLCEDCCECGICRESYGAGDEPETPVMLDCGHDFGQLCLEKWLSPYADEPRRTCPMCRAELFSPGRDGEPDAFEEVPFSPLAWNTLLEQEDVGTRFAVAADLIAAVEMSSRVIETYDRVRARRSGAAAMAEPYGPAPGDEDRTIAFPEGVILLFSPRVLFFFREFTRGGFLGSPESVEIANVIRSQMGLLYTRLRGTMRVMRMPTVWKEDGPPLSFLLDPAAIPLVENALERLVEIEEMWDWNESDNAE